MCYYLFITEGEARKLNSLADEPGEGEYHSYGLNSYFSNPKALPMLLGHLSSHSPSNPIPFTVNDFCI